MPVRVVTEDALWAAGAVDLSGYQLRSEKGQPNGYASLGDDGLVPDAQLPDLGGGGGGVSVIPTPQVFVNMMASPFDTFGFTVPAAAAGDYFGGEVQSNGLQNTYAKWQFYAQAGSYTLDLFHKTGPTRPIYTVQIDDVSLGSTIDGYSVSTASIRSSLLNVVIATSDVHSVTILAASKNASSTSYLSVLHGLALTRTGA